MEVVSAAGKAVRALAWLMVGAMVLLFAGYGAVRLINLHDEAPSADARRLQQLIDARPVLADDDNAYVYLLGMATIDGQDPLALGRQRRAYVEAYPVSGDPAAAGKWPGVDRDRLRSAVAQAVQRDCRDDGSACLELLEQQTEAVDAWLASARVEQERYRALISHRGWRESIPGSIAAPLPAWQPALDGQRLWLLSAWRHARAGETDATLAALQQDLLFWRGVLRGSDLLLTKMVATAAIRQHFAIGNIVVRELHRTTSVADVPAAWREAISPQERSLLRTVAGEWQYAKAAIALAGKAQDPALQAVSFEDVLARLDRPLFQPQATLNQHAALLVRLADSADAPYAGLQQSVEAATQPARVAWYRRLYNPSGRILSDIAGPAYADYAVRIADLEGLRRLALLAAELRTRPATTNTPTQTTRDVADALLRDPFSEAAFGWNAASGALEFQAHGRAGSREASVYRMPL